jgi:hypothetical protein
MIERGCLEADGFAWGSLVGMVIDEEAHGFDRMQQSLSKLRVKPYEFNELHDIPFGFTRAR